MATRVHLVRHGEVDDPDHLVYASLDGFGLSSLGVDQARAIARYLGRQPVVAIWSSPLERALHTAEPLAARVGQPVRVDPELTEWALMDRWAGVGWDDLPRAFPGELEAYLAQPSRLPFSDEALSDLATRLSATIRRHERSHPSGDVVIVTHSGPLRAATLALTGGSLDEYWSVTPGHGSVITLRPGPAWTVETIWTQEQP